MAMAGFSLRELYGGAITTELPSDYVDASNVRQVPDHQEVYLSPTQLTSLIFEINQYAAADSDADAVHLHFSDVIAPPDHLDGQPNAAKLISLGRASVKDFPAYITQGTIVSPEIEKKVPSALPVEWQPNPKTKDYFTKALLLVVRLAKYETDICIRVNLPLKELTPDQATAEEQYASEILEKIAGTLDVKDFGLFGTDE
ncbi:hypothetical protein DV738_g605, partial [Chaetothyriales sp. CBS 135597]